ncbi:MAG TPA: flagellar basal body rod protein FlgC [Gemmatimonadales bacterium]|jgi:flagellar basal-body rod protein FlgC
MADPTGGIPPLPRALRQLMGPLSTSASGMARQQKFIEVISNNIANAETTRTADGTPYKREVAIAGTDRNGALTTTVQQDTTDGRVVYDPGHPDHDAAGYVHYPNVDLATETVDLMVARRMHEANATVFDAAKAMLRRALDI